MLANVAGSFAADGLAARLRLEGGPGPRRGVRRAGPRARPSAGSTALIAAIAATADERPQGRRCAAPSSACSTSSASTTRWRASRAASSPRRCIEGDAAPPASERQRELAARRRRAPAAGRARRPRSRHAHAQQPHRPGRRVGAQQLDARSRSPAATSCVGAGERARARDRGPVVEPHLDRDRAPAALRARGPRTARPTSRAEHRLELLEVVDVGVERRLARDATWRARARSPPASRRGTPRATSDSAPCGRRTARRAAPRRPAGAGRPWRSRARPGARPSSGRSPGCAGRRGREAHARLLAAHGHEPGGLAQVRAALGHQARRPDAHRDLDPGGLADLGHQLAQHAQRLGHARQLGVRLVDAHLAAPGPAARSPAPTPRCDFSR